MLHCIVLAGGSGTRLFPISREKYPKQFIKLEKDGLSLFQQTLVRLYTFSESQKIPAYVWIVTNEMYKFYIKDQLEELIKEKGFHRLRSLEIELVFEPKGKNTAPAIALALREAGKRREISGDIFAVFPSDHLILPQDLFESDLKDALETAGLGYIVTFGIKPVRPETGFGYIKVDSQKIGRAYRVLSFVEKPSRDLAMKYISEGVYYWNSGMFIFSGKTIIGELETHAPEIGALLRIPDEEVRDYFLNEVPEISIDYAVMEKSDRLVLIPATFQWSDVGSWDSIYEVYEKNEDGLVTFGDVIALNSRNSLIISTERLVTAIGVEDLILVETPDVILLVRRGESQKVRDVVQILKAKNSYVAKEHLTEYRPWGSFTLLERGERYKIKKIIVKPGEALSLQMHHHRSEHWVVVRGTAKVQIGNEVKFVHENESIYIPKSTLHRLENPGKIPLEIIEVQVGEYVEEDDIIRFSDNYQRN